MKFLLFSLSFVLCFFNRKLVVDLRKVGHLTVRPEVYDQIAGIIAGTISKVDDNIAQSTILTQVFDIPASEKDDEVQRIVGRDNKLVYELLNQGILVSQSEVTLEEARERMISKAIAYLKVAPFDQRLEALNLGLKEEGMGQIERARIVKQINQGQGKLIVTEDGFNIELSRFRKPDGNYVRNVIVNVGIVTTVWLLLSSSFKS